jgi:cell division septation protein DedD
MARTFPIRLRTLTAGIVVIATGLIVWNAYLSIIGTTDQTAQALPIIKAETEPFRIVPDDPGGADIPNKGSRLFNVLNADHGDELALDGIEIKMAEETEPPVLAENEETETGFTIPEIPEPRRESLYDEIIVLKDAEVIEEDETLTPLDEPTKQDLKEKLQLVIAQVEINKEEAVTDKPLIEDVAQIIPVPTAKPKAPEPQIPAPEREFSLDRLLEDEAQPISGNYYMQLASLQSEQAARDIYAALSGRYPDIIGGAGVRYDRANLGARGVFYRIQVGPFSKAEADSQCESYRRQTQETCLVIRR